MATHRRRAQEGSPWAPRAWGRVNSTLPKESLNVPLLLLMGSMSPEVQDWTGDRKVQRDDRQPLLGPSEANLCPAVIVSHTD